MNNSILASVKKDIGGSPNDRSFDPDLIRCINSTFSILTQLGVGPKSGFTIESDSETWDDFFGETKQLSFVRTYVSTKVRLMFDPPQSSFLRDSLKQICDELEWRINVEAEKVEK